MPSNINVLLVDDNTMVLDLLGKARAHSCSVQTISDGADALVKAIDEKPDLIITDFAMSGMDARLLLDESTRDAEHNVLKA